MSNTANLPTKTRKVVETFERYGFTVTKIETNESDHFITHLVRVELPKGGNGLTDVWGWAGTITRKTGTAVGFSKATTSFLGGSLYTSLWDRQFKTWRDFDWAAYSEGRS